MSQGQQNYFKRFFGKFEIIRTSILQGKKSLPKMSLLKVPKLAFFKMAAEITW